MARFSTDEQRWQAICERDNAAIGEFFYAVKTTGIFCRPCCASRLPKRENVEFFENTQAALTAGYRACKRCHPCSSVAEKQHLTMITRACKRLTKENAPTLGTLAEDAGLSPWHFQRVFKRIVGITPKQYATASQVQRFFQSLTVKQSVTDAIYAAGFSSSSRAYENARLKPFFAHRSEQAIHYGISNCFLGHVLMAIAEKGICSILFAEQEESLVEQLQKRFPKTALLQDDALLDGVIEYGVCVWSDRNSKNNV